MAWIHVLEALNGRKYRHGGISGTLETRRDDANHRTIFMHHPDAAGKRTKAYQAMRAKLGDDWSTDLAWSEQAVTVAYKVLGREACDRICALPKDV